MKFLILVLVLFLVGCSSENNEVVPEDDKSTYEEKKETYVDDNPIKLGLYLYDSTYSNKELLEDTYYTSFVSGKDIDSFEVFFTDDKVVSGNNFKDIWYKYYNNYSDINNYKIGFNIKFILSDGTDFNGNFLEPDILKYGDYFLVYLYDDVNQEDNVIYSHLEKMEDNTLITSIKLHARDGIDKVENIILTVFTYDGVEDFDSDGNYRGNSSYTIRIKRK